MTMSPRFSNAPTTVKCNTPPHKNRSYYQSSASHPRNTYKKIDSSCATYAPLTKNLAPKCPSFAPAGSYVAASIPSSSSAERHSRPNNCGSACHENKVDTGSNLQSRPYSHHGIRYPSYVAPHGLPSGSHMQPLVYRAHATTDDRNANASNCSSDIVTGSKASGTNRAREPSSIHHSQTENSINTYSSRKSIVRNTHEQSASPDKQMAFSARNIKTTTKPFTNLSPAINETAAHATINKDTVITDDPAANIHTDITTASSSSSNGSVVPPRGCRVLLRLRPESISEVTADPNGGICAFIEQDGSSSKDNIIQIQTGSYGVTHVFKFDKVFDQNTTQREFYRGLLHTYDRSEQSAPTSLACTPLATLSHDQMLFARIDSDGNGETGGALSSLNSYAEQIGQGEGAKGKGLIDTVLQGYNASIIAYGQTGSGKTYSMLGESFADPFLGGGGGIALHDEVSKGLIPRLMEDLFKRIKEWEEPYAHFSIRASFIQIYNEKVRDLICPSKDNLKIRELLDQEGVLSGLGNVQTEATEVPVKNVKEVLGVIESGTNNRIRQSTKCNEHSSRSHAIFILNISKSSSTNCSVKTSQIYLVDLAGSEKLSKSCASGERLREAQNINRSLLALGNVIQVLSTTKPGGGGPGDRNTKHSRHVPYRDSKLTRLLQNSFGGNSYTLVVLCCSPHSFNAKETVSTLRFGDRAHRVQNRPTAQVALNTQELQRQLQQVNLRLREQECKNRDLNTLMQRQQLCIHHLLNLLPDNVRLPQELRGLLKRIMQSSSPNFPAPLKLLDQLLSTTASTSSTASTTSAATSNKQIRNLQCTPPCNQTKIRHSSNTSRESSTTVSTPDGDGDDDPESSIDDDDYPFHQADTANPIEAAVL